MKESMSETEKKVSEAPDIAEDLHKQFTEDPPKKADEPKVRCCYTVGITADNQPFFKVMGQMTIIDLEGVHKYAGRRIDGIVESRLGTGDSITELIAEQMAQLLYISDQYTKAKDGNVIIAVDAQGRPIRE